MVSLRAQSPAVPIGIPFVACLRDGEPEYFDGFASGRAAYTSNSKNADPGTLNYYITIEVS